MEVGGTIQEGKDQMPPWHNRVERIKEYVLANLSADLSTTAVADTFQFSTSTLQHIFKKFTGYTFQKYVEETRMMKAYHLLTKEGKIIKEVMHLTGYTTRSTFYRAFKKHFKKPPRYFMQ